MKETVAVTGGRGMLGSDLTRKLRLLDYEVRVLDLPEFDLTDSARLESCLDGVKLIVNCAAFTNVDLAEKCRETAMRVNALGPGMLGAWARSRMAYVIHISTDYVFDGASSRPYVETDIPNPLSVYGRSKLEGENNILQSGCHLAILRVQWSYGLHGKNFITKLVESARSGKEFKVVSDQVGAPTWTEDIAGAICALLAARQEGVFHYASAGYASRYEVALFAAGKLGLTNRIIPCSSADFALPAIRPKNSRFCTDKIKKIPGCRIRPWEEALSEFLAQAGRRLVEV